MTDPATDRTDDGIDTVRKTVTASGVVTREVDGEEQDLLRVPVSSTRPDREGDRFTKEALEGMADQIRVEQPMVFDNHGLAGGFMEAIPYDSRETIGAQMDAEVESADDGEWDLYALVNPDGTHPEGERLLGQVRDEAQPVKFSVGFRVLDYDAIEDDGGNEIGREFTRADHMETSRVGIPANPDASVTQSLAAKDGAAGLSAFQNHPMVQLMQAMGHGGTGRDAAGHDTVVKDGTSRDAVDSDTVDDATPVRTDGQGEEKEDKPKCDSDADCPEGEVCEDGHCVDADGEASTDPDGTKAPDDIGPADFAEYVASHYDGADSADVTDALSEVGDYVGEVDVPELAAHVAGVVDEETGTVQDQFDEWLGEGDDEETDAGDVPADIKEELEERRQAEEELREEIRELRESGLDRGESESGDTQMDANDFDTDDDADDGSTDNKTAMDLARESENPGQNQ